MIGERLAEIRGDFGDTQASLAEKLHVSPFTVSSWEQEKSAPNHEMLVKICRLYQVSSDYLLGLSDEDFSSHQCRQEEIFTKEELADLKAYEDYLLWKRKDTKA